MTDASQSETLEALLKIDARSLDDERAMNLAALLVDSAAEARNSSALDHALAVIGQLEARSLTEARSARLQYFRANVWSARRALAPPGWHWLSAEIDAELLALRSAIASPGFVAWPKIERAQAHTNLGNLLSHIGRFVEAIESWDQATALVPNMAMANGNRGAGFGYYAAHLYDAGQSGVLAVAARRALGFALAPDAIWESAGLEEARTYFAQYAAAIDARMDVEAVTHAVEQQRYSLGRSAKERRYREWALRHRLFLNPLNDVGPNAIAARDILTLPTLTTVGLEGGPGPPTPIHHFNILKQEYVTARFALHEALTASGVHFSDRDVLLYDTLDQPAVGFAVERAKLAFRSAYALLDKVAYFLNGYLVLGHGERQVSFRNLWFEPKKKTLHSRFAGAANWPLRGLYWLSKDIFDDAFRSVNTPDARELYELRNHLEHKFVSVHDDFLLELALMRFTPNEYVYHIKLSDLTARALRQLKLSRAALIYFSLGVHAEEKRRNAERGDTSVTFPMTMFTVRDASKRTDWG
jgi:hypothetical protein